MYINFFLFLTQLNVFYDKNNSRKLTFKYFLVELVQIESSSNHLKNIELFALKNFKC